MLNTIIDVTFSVRSSTQVQEKVRHWNADIAEMTDQGFDSLFASRKRDVDIFFNNIKH